MADVQVWREGTAGEPSFPPGFKVAKKTRPSGYGY